MSDEYRPRGASVARRVLNLRHAQSINQYQNPLAHYCKSSDMIMSADIARAARESDTEAHSSSDWASTPVAPAPAGYTSNLVDPSSIGWKFTTVSIIGCVVFVVTIGLRLYTRCFILRAVSYDDYISIFALVAWFVCFAVFTLDVRYGMGKHIWDVSLADYSPHFLLMWTMSAVVYITAMLAIKFSILMMYRRLFPIQNFRWRWWAVTLFTFGYSIGGILATVFSCTPIHAAWDITVSDRHCINTGAFYIANGVLNSISDLMILFLALPIVWGLALKKRDKLTLCALFGLGGVSCIMSIVRLKVLIVYLKNNTSDPTYYLGDVGVWTDIELMVSCVCSCLPTFRPLVERCFPRLRSTYASRTRSQHRDRNDDGDAGLELKSATMESLFKPHINGISTFYSHLPVSCLRSQSFESVWHPWPDVQLNFNILPHQPLGIINTVVNKDIQRANVKVRAGKATKV
ncbi:hypothetical protein KCV07_g440, partial [Aureobasidium melanogenum]